MKAWRKLDAVEDFVLSIQRVLAELRRLGQQVISHIGICSILFGRTLGSTLTSCLQRWTGKYKGTIQPWIGVLAVLANWGMKLAVNRA
jgi:hypothetical protein